MNYETRKKIDLAKFQVQRDCREQNEKLARQAEKLILWMFLLFVGGIISKLF